MSPSDSPAPSAADAFAAAFASLVTYDDVIGTITKLMLGCVESIGAESAGLVLKTPGNADELELLASTSHRAEELELYQLQSRAGPCVDAVRLGDVVVASDLHQIAERWPNLERAFADAAYSGVRATPLCWHGSVLGALNVFWSDGGAMSDDYAALVQGFADVATIAILHAGWISPAHLVERTRTALAGRAVIEQAKGVLAHDGGVDMSSAFDALVVLAHERAVSLSAAARVVLVEAGAPE